MFDAVCSMGRVSPLCNLPAVGVPGLTSIVMSSSAVLGRTSMVAFL